MEVHGQGHGAAAGLPRRRRRPPRAQRRPVQDTGSAMAAGPFPGTTSSETSCDDLLRPPPCIVDWSNHVSRAVEDLAYAVVVSVIGDGPLAAVEEVAAVIASRIEVVASSLVLRHASSSSYLLVLPELAMVERLVGLQQPISSPGVNFRLLCKRWSRLSGGHGRVLPFLLDIELRGIPNHVWGASIVDRLLCPLAWVQQVHPDTLGLVDLSCFRCLAWSTDPSVLPSTRELWVVEPPTAPVEDPPVKRVLAYPAFGILWLSIPGCQALLLMGGMLLMTQQDGDVVSVPHLRLPALFRRRMWLSATAAVLVRWMVLLWATAAVGSLT